MVLMLAPPPSKACRAVMIVLACEAFAVEASCAVAPWVNTPTSTRARSGATDTDAVPTAVMDAGRTEICAQDTAANTTPIIRRVSFIERPSLAGLPGISYFGLRGPNRVYTSPPSIGALLCPPVAARILRPGEHAAFQRTVEILAPGAGRKTQNGAVQSVKWEVVAVNAVAFRRAGTSVARSPKVVLDALADRACGENLG